MSIEPMDLTVITAPSPFILTTQSTAPFTLSGGAGATISLQLTATLSGGVDLRGPVGAPRALSAFVGGVPNDGEVVASGLSPYTFDVSSSSSFAEALTAATAETVFLILCEGVQIGTVTFAIGTTIGTVAYTSTTVNARDLVSIIAPNPADATLADITFLIG